MQELGDGGFRDGSGEDTERADHEVRQGAVAVDIGAVFRVVWDLGRVFPCNGSVKKALLERKGVGYKKDIEI